MRRELVEVADMGGAGGKLDLLLSEARDGECGHGHIHVTSNDGQEGPVHV